MRVRYELVYIKLKQQLHYSIKRSCVLNIAGVDEVGRGPMAGPVVACAVILRRSDFTVRIDDSKKLTRTNREKAYKEILDRAYIGIGFVEEDVIDTYNIYRSTIMAMEKAVLSLDIQPDLLIIDGNTRTRLAIPQFTIVKGDQKCLSIACASIVAKVLRDRLLVFYDQLFPEYGFAAHKGYGTELHRKMLKERGPSVIHRRSFSFNRHCERSEVKQPVPGGDGNLKREIFL
ncbi:MAG: ribonuclease HII [Candidatus Omnitrophota bacterium]